MPLQLFAPEHHQGVASLPIPFSQIVFFLFERQQQKYLPSTGPPNKLGSIKLLIEGYGFCIHDSY